MDSAPFVNYKTSATQLHGDANLNRYVDIVDSLIAEYFVGIFPEIFDMISAKADCDSNITIVDALLVAQFYVGLISSLAC